MKDSPSSATQASRNPLQRLRALWVQQQESRALKRGLPVRDRLDPSRSAGGVSVRSGFDQALLAMVMALVAMGVVMVYSASVALSESPKYANVSQNFFLMRHLLYVGLAVALGFAALQLPMAFWEKHAAKLFIFTLLLLMLVLIPFIGIRVNGSRRWLPMGLMNFQPSELAKLTMALYAASYMVRKMDVKEDFFKAVWPMAVATGFMGMLVLGQTDVGAFLVIVTVAMSILFLGGVNARMFFLMVAVVALCIGLFLAFDPVRSTRILAFMNPWDPQWERGKAWQLTNSLIAFGMGSWFGQGLGSSLEKLHWLPEAHTDFLFAVIGEELGLVGVVTIIVAYFWLVRRMVAIGRQAIQLDRVFSGLFAQGVAMWFGFQAFIHMGVNLGVLPTKGLTLPLMSYGGSALLLNALAVALVLRVDMENQQLMRRGVQ
ncbi:MAG: putative lipid II flippase FtsW [Rubrivivax sp.]|jgi:cell division protein FtsW|nr:putative lipid II flippase FtsW [Rubrivivax sp.]